ncbi:hypothetical protein AB0M29_29895 [Streptomyces sp. NPDC051976]|uniref:hypothetical protein n=1 Tax=Streptomyces sp. NPDC051976 TaxID=3154947 RepID=UPI00341ECF56
MSGPLSLVGAGGETGGTASDTAGVAAAGGVSAALPRLSGRRRAPSWAVTDPVAELAERLNGPCAAAVHPDEIAAVLESEGLTEEQLTGVYGHPDIFSLARELFAIVPRAFPEPEPGDDPWRADVSRCVLRGLTFALPGVAYVLGGRWAGGGGGPFGVSRAVAAWGAAALVGWGWNQGLAHRAHLHLLLHHPRTAVRCLLSGAAAGALLATLAAAAVAGPSRLPALAFAAGQSLYVAAATVLLVLGRERSLLHVLAPLSVAVLAGASALPSPAVAALLAATVAAATTAAVTTALRAVPADDATPEGGSPRRGWRALRRPRNANGTPDGGAHTGTGGGTDGGARRAWRALRRRRQAPDGDAHAGTDSDETLSPYLSLPHGLAGLAGGGLVVAAALAGEFVAALTVSMGVAEWLLYRFRSRSLRALRRTGVRERLLRRAWPVLVACLLGYAAALAALAGAEALLVPGAPAWDTPHLGVLLALGATLWLALLLQSCGRPWTGTCVLGTAAVTAVVLLAAHTAPPGTVLVEVCAAAATVLLGVATALTGRVTTHR